MLPTQINTAIQTDLFPIQNIGVLEQNPPQIYSTTPGSSNPSPTKKSSRKKPRKLDELTRPVQINPQITRTPLGVTFDAPHHRSAIMYDSIQSLVRPPFLNGYPWPLRFYKDHNSYDVNNNINHNRIPLPVQAQQISAWLNNIRPVVNANLISQMNTKPPSFGMNHVVNNNISEKLVSVSVPQQNEYRHRNPSTMLHDQRTLANSSHSDPSSIVSVSTNTVPVAKRKRKCSRKIHPPVPVEQQQPVQEISQNSDTLVQHMVTNGLPNIIPSSVTVAPIKSGEQLFSLDTAITPNNCSPLLSPSSICSTKSPPMNITTESTLIPIPQKNSLPQNTIKITEVNSIPNTHFHDQGSSHTQQATKNSSTNQLSLNLHNLLAASQSSYYAIPQNLIPINILSMGCSSILPGTIPSTFSGPISKEMKNAKKKREKTIRKPTVIENPTVQMETDAEAMTSEMPTQDVSTIKKRKPKNFHMKDKLTKKQLRRIARRNQLTVLKYMIQKRKLQKQERKSVSKVPDVKAEQMVPQLSKTHRVKPENVETNLPDIIAPSLKISFDATQKIESIVLYYHRRRRPDIVNENSLKSSLNSDNRLGLLIEAVEFIETLNESSKIALSSGK